MTPPDGSIPRMQMYRTTYSNPNRDTSLDNVIIAHEYGHGLSIRLTGGPETSSCLNNDEQAGEGFSDLLGMFMTHLPADTRTTQRGTGDWSFAVAGGIRNAPYTTDMNVNGYTYAQRSGAGLSIPHGVGFLWATIYWEVYWNIIDMDGFDPDLTAQGSGGNNAAVQLYVEGMKLQPCSPNFVHARDAIFDADQQLYNGRYKCAVRQDRHPSIVIFLLATAFSAIGISHHVSLSLSFPALSFARPYRSGKDSRNAASAPASPRTTSRGNPTSSTRLASTAPPSPASRPPTRGWSGPPRATPARAPSRPTETTPGPSTSPAPAAAA